MEKRNFQHKKRGVSKDTQTYTYILDRHTDRIRIIDSINRSTEGQKHPLQNRK